MKSQADSVRSQIEVHSAHGDRIPHGRSIPMYLCHGIAIAGPFLVRFSWSYVALAGVLYVVRMIALSAGYHRYFAHRTYRTSRAFQFVLAFVGGTCTQRGALWWAANHRWHHAHADQAQDVHSPGRHGFFWSHLGWILSKRFERGTSGSGTSPRSRSCAGWTATTSSPRGRCSGACGRSAGGRR